MRRVFEDSSRMKLGSHRPLATLHCGRDEGARGQEQCVRHRHGYRGGLRDPVPDFPGRTHTVRDELGFVGGGGRPRHPPFCRPWDNTLDYRLVPSDPLGRGACTLDPRTRPLAHGRRPGRRFLPRRLDLQVALRNDGGGKFIRRSLGRIFPVHDVPRAPYPAVDGSPPSGGGAGPFLGFGGVGSGGGAAANGGAAAGGG